jgi:uncharacterized protein
VGVLREVRVVAVGLEAGEGSPIVLLQEVDRADRVLPVWVGLPEAAALTAEWRGVRSSRPGAHQLMSDVIDACGRRLAEVRVVALVDGVFHAELVLDAGTVVPARPSDAVALALHRSAPVLVEERVLDEAALPADRVSTGRADAASEATDATDEELARFRRFLGEVDPEDFGP